MSALNLIAIMPEGTSGVLPDRYSCKIVDGMTVVFLRDVASAIVKTSGQKERLLSFAAYHASLEGLLPFGTVIPVKQGTQIADADIVAFVRGNSSILAEIAEKLIGLHQYQISVSWESASVLGHFRDTSELAHLFSQGRTDVRTINDSVARLADRLRNTIVDILSEVVSDIIRLPTAGDTITNLVVLVPVELSSEFERVMVEIDNIWTDGFRIRQIGPSAATSFASLNPRWISSSAIQTAKSCLNLDIRAGVNDIDLARKSLLRSSPGQSQQINSAAQIMRSAVQSGSEDGFFLCDVWRDGTAQVRSVLEDIV